MLLRGAHNLMNDRGAPSAFQAAARCSCGKSECTSAVCAAHALFTVHEGSLLLKKGICIKMNPTATQIVGGGGGGSGGGGQRLFRGACGLV